MDAGVERQIEEVESFTVEEIEEVLGLNVNRVKVQPLPARVRSVETSRRTMKGRTTMRSPK